MVDFPQTVAVPPTSAYGPGIADFSPIANAPNTYYQGQFNQQQKQLNDAKIAQAKQQIELAKSFAGGLPTDSSGQIDYRAAAGIFASKGDIRGAISLLQLQPAPLSPMFGGQGQGQPQGGPAGPAPAPPGGPPSAGAPPQSVQARPLPPPSRSSPQGDSGNNTITSLVTDRLPSQNQTTGQTIMKIAEVMGVDPNAEMTPGQLRRAQGLLAKYAPDIAGVSPGQGGGNLPPSANAVSPRPSSVGGGAGGGTPPGAGAPTVGDAAAPAPVATGAAGPPAAAPQPPQGQPPQPQPIGSQVPLPQGFTDPQKAALALRAEAARLSQYPRAQGQVQELNNWAARIEDSVKPLAVRPGETLLDPRTGQPVYQGNQPTLSPQATQDAAERYLQTGQFPPNMGRGTQGTADRNAILEESNRLALERGLNTAELPQKWQQFKAQQIAVQRFGSGKEAATVRSFNVLVDHLDTLSEAASALKNGDIRVFNKWKQTWAAQTGETAPTNFDGVKALVGDEIVKAVVGGAGALADREEVKKDLDRASSPKQLAELVERYRKLALGQLKGLRKEFTTSTGLGEKDFNDKLLPGTLSALGGNKGEGSAPDADGWVSLPNGARIREVK